VRQVGYLRISVWHCSRFILPPLPQKPLEVIYPGSYYRPISPGLRLENGLWLSLHF